MALYNINVANEINATFVTYYGRFNCNICNILVGEFIYIQNILSMAIKGRRKNFSFLCPLFPFSNRSFLATLIL